MIQCRWIVCLIYIDKVQLKLSKQPCIRQFLYYFNLQQLRYYFLTVFIPVNFPCGRKPEHPEKTHDFRQSVDWLFSHESVARIQPTPDLSEVKGACFEDCATEAQTKIL
jgi:hypothetical protein